MSSNASEHPEPAAANAERCGLCAYLDSSPLAGWVYEDDLWKAGIYPTNEVPGWIALVLRRHAEATSELREDEARSLGPALARLSGAIEQATGAERVYLQVYGETFRHWHVLLSARGAEIPLEHRHAAFHPHMAEYVDVPAAAAAGRRIADALAARA